MDFLKAIFGDKPLTYEEFTAAVKEAKLNIVDLSKGGYVSQAKFDDKMAGLSQQVSDLNAQIAQRDKDMATLRASLEAAQADAGKLPGVQQTLTDLQAKYDADKSAFEKRISDQQYEYMVRERANSLHFSSTAAKRAFLQEAIGKGFKVDGENLLGYEDFLTKYKTEDPGAFATETPPEDPKPAAPTITLPGKSNPPAGHKMSLSEMMRAKNENPDLTVDF